MTVPLLSAQARQALQGIYASPDFLEGHDALPYAVDESHALKPCALGVVFPRSHRQVVDTVLWANRFGIPLVPSGGRTGLSGGACAGSGELVVSLQKMNRILAFDPVGGLLSAEAGVVLENLQQAAAEKGWFYPVDYASRGSAQIGGAVATNAGGIRVLRYGMTRHWVAGLKAVTGSGETLDLNRHVPKDNAGYDLQNLLVGAEGTLAIITEVTVRLTRPMPVQQTLLAGVGSMADMLALFSRVRTVVELNAAEFFCANALQHVMSRHGDRQPFATRYPFYLLLEFDEHPGSLEAVSTVLGDCETVIAASLEQTRQLWRYRELVSSTINPLNPLKHDIACRLSAMPGWFADLEQVFADVDPRLKLVWFGHLGDGNLHLNILAGQGMTVDDFSHAIEQCTQQLCDITRKHQAVISAEHGVGVLKTGLLPFARSATEISLYRQIRQVFDPRGILNPGKLL